MKTFGLILLLTAAIGITTATAAPARLPASPEELRHQFEAALRAKDTNAIASLICWNNVSDADRAGIMKEATTMVHYVVDSVSLSPWPTNYPTTFGSNGARYHLNLPVTGMVTVKFLNQQGIVGTQMPYGKSGDGYLMAATVQDPKK